MPRQDHSQVTDEQRETFLAALADGLSIVDAAKESGRDRRTWYRLKERDPEFATSWTVAYDEGTDLLEAEAQRRAVEGVDDFKMAVDLMVPVRRYSDTLLIFLLKARRPHKFRDNVKHEVTGQGGGPVQVEHRGVSLDDIVAVAREAGIRLDHQDG